MSATAASGSRSETTGYSPWQVRTDGFAGYTRWDYWNNLREYSAERGASGSGSAVNTTASTASTSLPTTAAVPETTGYSPWQLVEDVLGYMQWAYSTNQWEYS
jgi:hypothetical protein